LREWTLGIHWSTPLLKRLLPPALHGRLREAYCDPFYEYNQPVETTPIYNGKTGQLLKELSSPGMIRVSRSRLRALCSEAIPVRYSKALRTVTFSPDNKGVTAHFTDGSAVEGDIIIGADGPRSTVRELLLGQELAKPTALDLLALGAVVEYSDAKKAKHVRSGDPITCFSYCPDGIFAFISGKPRY
jgi:2-polyprenyl-6-methoxyphenol hydroxylase-like FAD-dependent oxidoreductase